jgi:hypothetical protein
MASRPQGRNQRRSPRIDVLLRVKGQLVPAGFPITILNVNRTGFAVLSDVWFRPGDRLELRLTAIKGPSVQVAGVAMHAQPVSGSPGLYMTGFTFQPDRPGGSVPDADIRQLIAAVAPAGFKI